jgi:Domain of unknown function (DUF2017)
MFRRAVERTDEGDFRVVLSPEEREILRGLPGELRSLLDEDARNPALRRLFPPAYEDDAEGEEEYRRLLEGELLAGRRKALAVLEETAGRERLAEDELHAWLGALNDLRLVLGTRIGVTEELYEAELDPADPQAAELALYLYLTWLQEELVAAVG